MMNFRNVQPGAEAERLESWASAGTSDRRFTVTPCGVSRSRGRVALITGAAAWPEDLATGERPGCKVPWGTCTQEVLSPGLGPERECCSCNTAPLQVLFQLDRKTQMLTSTIDPDHATHVVDSIGYLATPPRLPYGRLF
jgi:hypothetical protein